MHLVLWFIWKSCAWLNVVTMNKLTTPTLAVPGIQRRAVRKARLVIKSSMLYFLPLGSNNITSGGPLVCHVTRKVVSLPTLSSTVTVFFSWCWGLTFSPVLSSCSKEYVSDSFQHMHNHSIFSLFLWQNWIGRNKNHFILTCPKYINYFSYKNICFSKVL